MLTSSSLTHFSDAGIHDRIVIQELIKTTAQTHQFDSNTQKSFKGWLSIILLQFSAFWLDQSSAGRDNFYRCGGIKVCELAHIGMWIWEEIDRTGERVVSYL